MHGDSSRLEEANISASINKLNLLNLPKNIILKSNYFHKDLPKMIEIFSSFFGAYDLILSPMIEGGHQDHDSVTAALLISKNRTLLISKNRTPKFSNLLLFPTYRGLNGIPWLYRCGLPDSLFKGKRIYFSLPNKWIILILRTWFKAYISQTKAWILLLPALIIARGLGQLNCFINGNEFSADDIKDLIPKKPFYQIHRNLKRHEWIEYLGRSFIK